MATVKDLLLGLAELAPPGLALDWDNSGLQVGDPGAEAASVALALDPTPEAVDEAIESRCEVLLTHHPLIFKPLKKITGRDPVGQAVGKAVKADLAVVAAHTNWDAARQGVAWALAELLGLKDGRVLEPSSPGCLYKLTTFVPEGHEAVVKTALFKAGAGVIGAYDQCWFEASGQGGFRVPPDARPFVGRPGETAVVREKRLEVLTPGRLKTPVLNALLKAHPYEEPAWDLYPLANAEPGYGFGLLGRWERPLTLTRSLEIIKQINPHLKWAGPQGSTKAIAQVALMPGSGGDYAAMAREAGADMLVTGDVGHHQALEASGLGLWLVDAGHFETERPGLELLARRLSEWASSARLNINFKVLKGQNGPWRYF